MDEPSSSTSSIDPSKLIPETVDGVASEIPVITYTEKVIEAKQAQLKKYLHENYAKLQSVEKELENLNLELKLTSGSKKAGLEHLRSKVEKISEKIYSAKAKEDQAKKAWEEASKAVVDLEAEKKKLCDDLYLMVHENAMKQYERLEELTRKLDSLNPEFRSGVYQALEDIRAKIGPVAPLINASSTPVPVASSSTQQKPPETEKDKNSNTAASNNPSAEDKTKHPQLSSQEKKTEEQLKQPEKLAEGRGGSLPPKLGGRGKGRGRGRGGRGPLVLRSGMNSDAGNLNGGDDGTWTGAGFDVDHI